MDAIFWEWLSFFVRWTHVMAGIAWIGSSFYFVHLDQSLKQRPSLPDKAYGDEWQVHGGGFYHMVKYLVAPPQLPEHVTWFKWEAYATWLSGFALLVIVYYLGARLYLIDPQVMDIHPITAVAYSLGGVFLGWFIYNELCESDLAKSDLKLALATFAMIVAVAFIYSFVFSGRGAFMQVGVVMGTVMAANVFMVIIPNQRKVVAALKAGETPDPALGQKGKQRSLHNNYLTLPVVFVMIGNHYPLAFATRFSWAILALVIVMGVSIRHFYNTRHRGLPSPWWTWGVTAACAVAIMALSAAGPPPARVTETEPAAAESELRETAQLVVQTRCSMCHADRPLWPGIGVAPKGVKLETLQDIKAHAGSIRTAAVLTHSMPPGNVTEITPEERKALADWASSIR
ncbi:urate hydroxylase PuuD [Chelatococcus sambhunathii]|uniref:Urate hydroxylase PuuD n=1 Tax=Chelatococcus sambhunathii TaxID=363953 RepID=A0ABU1DD65_9HYPH|nr:urate hydroxylase PuuD [Chelatococcus sambhunathii]MDR4306048.1 urate hydroxylase PuuD [Chelatococcus sambhunathii]